MSSAHSIHAFPAASLRARVGVVALVLLVHGVILQLWTMLPERPVIELHEMSVTLAVQQAEVVLPQVQAQPEAMPQPKLQPRNEPAAKPAPQKLMQEVTEVVPLLAVEPGPAVVKASTSIATVVSTAPVADSEPDYQARYLNNPRPDYPMVARRMGWQGTVILNVEVLAEGACGALSVFRSSGHEVLDNAAINTVKTWRFTPARHAGRAVSQWFKVPINFSLEDNEV